MEKKKVIGYRFVPTKGQTILEHSDLNTLQGIIKQTYPNGAPGVIVHVVEHTRVIQTIGLVDNY